MTTIYLIRHSNTFNEHKGVSLTNEPLLIENEKVPLSILGEENASKYLSKNEFKNIDTVWSSNYVRAISTAKYIAHYNNLKVNIDESFNERIHGVESYKDLPTSFEELQFNNDDYKIGYGESKKEVALRMKKGIDRLLLEYKDKRIIIISHATAIMYYLSLYTKITYLGNCYFKDKLYFDGRFNYLETFKLEFNDKELVNITNIKGVDNE